ncbi:MAG: cytidylyltransferase domain-containing protein [Thermoguttaceae bacterium]
MFMFECIIIVQARMGSSRLPGKIWKPLHGEPVLSHIIERAGQVRAIDKVVLATTVQSQDDLIAEEAVRRGWAVFRGSEEDVLSRFYGAALEYPTKYVVRHTGDNLFVDTEALEQLLAEFVDDDYDYMKTNHRLALGTGSELFTFSALEKAYSEATKPRDRDWVTSYIYTNPNLFRMGEGKFTRGGKDYSNYRLTLDTPEDWSVCEAIFDAFYPEAVLQQHQIEINDVLTFLERNEEIRKRNAGIKQMSLDNYKTDAEMAAERTIKNV